ncbi:MAG TPA: archease [Gemmatimonadaceae bacterium]|nr:archease [Gemmatimonadaceae bacterium]
MRNWSRSEEHTGEWKVRVRADSLSALFAEVARVVAGAAGPARGPSGDWEPVALGARDAPALLVAWANELLGRGEVRRRAYRDVRRLTVANGRLTAQVRGPRVAEWRSPLKAATYHGLTLERRGRRWAALLLFDV